MAEKNSPRGHDSAAYIQRKNQYQRMLTVYGRKPVLEALQNSAVDIHRLHLANSNKPAKVIDDIIALCDQRGIEISYKEKAELSRISKNAKQDQGVAADLVLEKMLSLADFISTQAATNAATNARYLVLDCIHNPQNLGMIIRSAAAGGITALFIPEQGNAAISPLVIKASAGAVFKCPIVRAGTTEQCIQALREKQVIVSVLTGAGEVSLWNATVKRGARAFVLGNESEGVSPVICALADEQLCIPMQNDIESLNVAVTAALIAFLPLGD